MDLIFDAQVFRHRRADELPEAVLASIAAYYHRATTASRPMSYLIAAVMAILLGALGFQWFSISGWPLAVCTALAVVPILLASIHTVPSAKRLGKRAGSRREESRLARSICRDHLLCLAAMSAFLALWIGVVVS
jgi:hypothetical protein